MTTNPGKRDQASRAWRTALILVIIAAVIVLFRAAGLGDRIGELREWIRSLGALGPFVYVLIYIVAVVAALPGAAITIAGAAIFGSIAGVILVSIASTVGASLAFLISRYVAREAVLKRLSENETFRKLDRMTEEHGAIIVAITRLVPIFPFNLLNYGFGLTGIPFRTYVFWSWLCMLPGTVMYVVGTDALVSGLTRGRIPWLLVGVLVAAGIVLFLLVKMAKRRLDRGAGGKDGGPGGE